MLYDDNDDDDDECVKMLTPANQIHSANLDALDCLGAFGPREDATRVLGVSVVVGLAGAAGEGGVPGLYGTPRGVRRP